MNEPSPQRPKGWSDAVHVNHSASGSFPSSVARITERLDLPTFYGWSSARGVSMLAVQAGGSRAAAYRTLAHATRACPSHVGAELFPRSRRASRARITQFSDDNAGNRAHGGWHFTAR